MICEFFGPSCSHSIDIIAFLHQSSLNSVSSVSGGSLVSSINSVNNMNSVKSVSSVRSVECESVNSVSSGFSGLRDGSRYQTDEFSEKFERGGGSFSIQKFRLQILDLYKGLFSDVFRKKITI